MAVALNGQSTAITCDQKYANQRRAWRRYRCLDGTRLPFSAPAFFLLTFLLPIISLVSVTTGEANLALEQSFPPPSYSPLRYYHLYCVRVRSDRHIVTLVHSVLQFSQLRTGLLVTYATQHK